MSERADNIKYATGLVFMTVLGGGVAYKAATSEFRPEVPVFNYSHKRGLPSRKLYLWETMRDSFRVKLLDTNEDRRPSFGDSIVISNRRKFGPGNAMREYDRQRRAEKLGARGTPIMDENLFLPASTRRLLFRDRTIDHSRIDFIWAVDGSDEMARESEEYRRLLSDIMNSKAGAERWRRDFNARKRRR